MLICLHWKPIILSPSIGVRDSGSTVENRTFKRKKLNTAALVTSWLTTPSIRCGHDLNLLEITASTKNISAGGVLLELSQPFSGQPFVLIHLHFTDPILPQVILCEAIRTESDDDSCLAARFITREEFSDISAHVRFSEMPSNIFDFDRKKQDRLNHYLQVSEEHVIPS